MVGAVKSGKSTMINALVGQDLLRRGAGILTAMITRVQPGPGRRRSCSSRIGAKSTKKSIGPCAFFPTPASLKGPFDLQRADDRLLLAQVLAAGQRA